MITPDSIYLSLKDDLCVIRPARRLGDRFDAYRSCTDGARFDRASRANVCSLDKVPAILRRLRLAGFRAEAGGSLVQRLQVRQAEQWLDLQAVQDRVEGIDQEIRERSKAKGLNHYMYGFQKIGSTWLALRHGALLADDQGLGKTLSSIAALPAKARAVIVSPKSVKGEWVKEVAKWRPHLRTTVVEGRTTPFRWPNESECLLYNYEILPKPHKEGCDGQLPADRCLACAEVLSFVAGTVVTKKEGHTVDCDGFVKERKTCWGCASWLAKENVPPGVVVVLDEIQHVKNASSNMSRAASALALSAREAGGRSWGLSGTPMSNTPKELWTVLRVLGVVQEAFGNRDTFDRLFKAKTVNVTRDVSTVQYGVPDAEDEPELRERLQRVMLRRMKHEVLPDLPGKRWREIDVAIDKRTLKLVESLLGEDGGVESILSKLDLSKADGEPKFSQVASIRAALATAKIPAMIERVQMAEEEGEPLVVFSSHRAPIEKLAKRPGWGVIMGDSVDRAETIERFQAGKLKGIGCTIRAAGTGVTLTRAARMCFVDRDWTTTANIQAEDRCLRIGQDRGVVIDVLVADHPLDQRVTEILLRKQRLIDRSVDAVRTDEGAAGSVREEAEAFVRQLKEVQAEISLGRAVRRMAESPEDERSLRDLERLRFEGRSDDRVATDLLEQAHLTGLSDAQWDLARRIAARGGEPPEVETRRHAVVPEKGESKNGGARRSAVEDDDGMVMVSGDPHLRECAMVRSRDLDCSCGSVPSGVRG